MRENLLDDWVDGRPDAWDYEAVLKDNKATVLWYPDAGWCLEEAHGTTGIGRVPEVYARKAAAMFISLWERGVSASFANKLMEGYLMYLSYQDKGTKICLLKNIQKNIDELNVQPDEEILVTLFKRKKLNA
jgi:hypothetical protein